MFYKVHKWNQKIGCLLHSGSRICIWEHRKFRPLTLIGTWSLFTSPRFLNKWLHFLLSLCAHGKEDELGFPLKWQLKIKYSTVVVLLIPKLGGENLHVPLNIKTAVKVGQPAGNINWLSMMAGRQRILPMRLLR